MILGSKMSLVSKRKMSKGHIKDLTGSSFGRLTVLGLSKIVNGHSLWLCLCICGNRAQVWRTSLTSGDNRSCGCLKNELSKTHGMSTTVSGEVPSEYAAYMNAKYRCTNPKAQGYAGYGGRGIEFLFSSFEQFYSELGPQPKGKTLDRIENGGNYEPGNVRWATPKQQAANR